MKKLLIAIILNFIILGTVCAAAQKEEFTCENGDIVTISVNNDLSWSIHSNNRQTGGASGGFHAARQAANEDCGHNTSTKEVVGNVGAFYKKLDRDEYTYLKIYDSNGKPISNIDSVKVFDSRTPMRTSVVSNKLAVMKFDKFSYRELRVTVKVPGRAEKKPL